MTIQNARNHRHSASRRRKLPLRAPVTLAILAALCAPAALAEPPPTTLPKNMTLRSGNATLRPPVPNTPEHPNAAYQMVIDQTSKGAIIDWTSFSIGAMASVEFKQQDPNVGIVTLNRVTGGSMSEIFGRLSSDGTVFLINPNGVLFGAGSTVNVGGLVASTLNITNEDFNQGLASGTFTFVHSNPSGEIVNNGTVTVLDFGTAALLASRVENSGTIATPRGTIALGAGSRITLDIGGDGLTQMVINTGAANPNGAYVRNEAGGELTADGGQVLMQSTGGPYFADTTNSGTIQALSLQSRNGRVVLSASAGTPLNSTVHIEGNIDTSGTTVGVAGGRIEVTGANVQVSANPLLPPGPVTLDASGANGGGSISIDASNIAAIDNSATLKADAVGNGDGGSIRVNGASGGLYALGSFFARGGAAAGNGGSVETSGNGVYLNGITVDARAPNGTAGTWTIDPYNVTIVHGSASGSLPTLPFTPVADTTIQDGDINNALNSGSNVTITTGALGVGDDTAGNIYLGSGEGAANAARIVSNWSAPLTFRLDANAGISGSNFTINSSNAPLNVVFNSDANNRNHEYGDISFSGDDDHLAEINTHGGDIWMFGQSDPINGFATSLYGGGIFLEGVTLDSRGSGTGGDIVLRGRGGNSDFGYAVDILGSSIHASAGSISIFGDGSNENALGSVGGGVAIEGTESGTRSVLETTTGSITITGLSDSGGSSNEGIEILDSDIRSTSGLIDLRGRGGAYSDGFSDGLTTSGAAITSSDGDIRLTGSSGGDGTGLRLALATWINAGSGNVVLRARNDGSTDAIIVGGSATIAGSLVNLRPGSVDANGNAVENASDPIVLGSATGFAITQAEMDNISGRTVVFGSDIQTGAITVSSPIAWGSDLTLQAGAGGNIAIQRALDVRAGTLALLSAGAITQTAAIQAGSLLARSSGAGVLLGNAANNVSAATLAGSGATGFTFVNSGSVGIGPVSTYGFSAVSNAATTQSGTGIDSGGNVLVRALGGNMILNGNVSGGASIDLVSTGIFNNAGGNSIAAGGTWRVWGNTWVGESRGIIAGSGALPNLYGCTYGTGCTSGIAVPATDNHFIYTQRPTLIVDLDSATREYGLPNGTITYGVTGLILGDVGTNVLTGTTATAATQASDVGNYPITGTFASPAGYIVTSTRGTLAVTPAALTYVAGPYTRTYGDPNGTLTGAVTGFRLSDTLATATTGALAWTTAATPASNVGTYAITGSGLSARNYVFAQAPGNATALTVTPATLVYTANPSSRLYGDPNGPLSGRITGFRLADTLASATNGTLAWGTPATQASSVGTYAINGSGLGAGNYVFAQAPDNATALTITPATLTYTADPYGRYVGTPTGTLGGSITGFRNGDTLAGATTGALEWSTPADTYSPVGSYTINGAGLLATNYVFAQHPDNATALAIWPVAQTYTVDPVRDTPDSYVYDRNFQVMPMCPSTDLLASTRNQDGDNLTREWSRVRSRPNLANCVTLKLQNDCDSF